MTRQLKATDSNAIFAVPADLMHFKLQHTLPASGLRFYNMCSASPRYALHLMQPVYGGSHAMVSCCVPLPGDLESAVVSNW